MSEQESKDQPRQSEVYKTDCNNPNCQSVNSGIDECIRPMINALNAGGIETVASCCGHRNTIGTIALKDGRELLIAKDFETARKINSHFPDIHGNSQQGNKELRFTRDGALAECPCCGSLDVGGAHDTVNCYGCGLTITKERPLQNACDAWNKRT